MKKIDFYFDFLSPYSYFGWINHQKKLADFKVEFEYRPVLMGKLFSHFEFPGPGEIRVKRDYELKQCFRYAAKNSIEFTPPSSFPFNPLAIIRCATRAAASDKQYEVIDCLFKAVWAQGIILEDPELIEKIFLENNLSKDIVEQSFSREAKIELKANIKDALGRNIFGVPTFSLDDEYFWGNDSLDTLKDYLADNDNWNKELYCNLVKE